MPILSGDSPPSFKLSRWLGLLVIAAYILGVGGFAMAQSLSAQQSKDELKDNRHSNLRPPASQWRSLFHDNVAVDNSSLGSYLSALQAMRGTDRGKAAAFFLEAVARDPQSSHLRSRAFYQLVDVGRVDEAAVMAQALASTKLVKPDDSPVRLDPLMLQVAALAHFRRSEWQDADRYLRMWVDASPGNFVPILMEAWAMAGAGQRDAALNILEDLRASGGFARTMAEEHLAYIYDYLGDVSAARGTYAALARRQMVSVQLYLRHVALILREDGISAAQDKLQEYINKASNNKLLRDEAGKLFAPKTTEAFAANPAWAMAGLYLRLATELGRSGGHESAVIYLHFVEYLRPARVDTALMLASEYQAMERFQEAADALGRVASTDPIFNSALLQRIRLLMRAENIDTAKRLITSFMTVLPETTDLRLNLADILRGEGKMSAALAEYDQVIAALAASGQENWYPYFARGAIYDELDDWPAAEADLKKALALNPGGSTIQNYLGYSWVDRGHNMEQGRALIEQALASDPKNGFINDSLGWVYYLLGDYKQAVHYLEIAVGFEPSDVTITDHLGDAYWRLGRPVEARYQWRHALDNGAEGDELAAIREKLAHGLADQPEKRAGA